MGDFNAIMNPAKTDPGTNNISHSGEDPEIPLLTFLSENGYIDLQEAWEGDQTSSTWQNHNSSSRIDYIWATQDIALDFIEFQNKQIQEITASDHTILKMVTR
jgi:Exonuclease III